MFIIAESVKCNLEKHVEYNCSGIDDWLFKGRKSRNIHHRSVQEAVKKAVKDACIKKNVHCHTLRHSFATHLIEAGYSLQVVQQLMGHSSSQTTMVYIHVAAPKMIDVKSPYDTL